MLDAEVSRLPKSCREAILRCYFDGQMRQGCSSVRLVSGHAGATTRPGPRTLAQRLTVRGTTLAVVGPGTRRRAVGGRRDCSRCFGRSAGSRCGSGRLTTAWPCRSSRRLCLNAGLLLGLLAGSALAPLPLQPQANTLDGTASAGWRGNPRCRRRHSKNPFPKGRVGAVWEHAVLWYGSPGSWARLLERRQDPCFRRPRRLQQRPRLVSVGCPHWQVAARLRRPERVQNLYCVALSPDGRYADK